MGFLTGKRVLLTGGAGFLGRYVCKRLRSHHPHDIFIPRSSSYDLCRQEAVKDLFIDAKPDVVIHLAAAVGGIGANRENPGRFFYANTVMGVELMEVARRFGVQKFVCVGTVCSYPKHTPTPFKESDLWNGYPEETNAPYGIAKKALLVQAQAYRQQYGFNVAYVIPTNLYGPGDDFDLASGHVIPAMIRKFLDGPHPVTFWGTGEATRDFLYVEDAAEAIVTAAERYCKPEPMNIGTGVSTSIKDLAGILAKICGYEGEVCWDGTYPNGQPLRCLDVRTAWAEINWVAQTSLWAGLQKTVEWYRTNRETKALK